MSRRNGVLGFDWPVPVTTERYQSERETLPPAQFDTRRSAQDLVTSMASVMEAQSLALVAALGSGEEDGGPHGLDISSSVGADVRSSMKRLEYKSLLQERPGKLGKPLAEKVRALTLEHHAEATAIPDPCSYLERSGE